MDESVGGVSIRGWHASRYGCGCIVEAKGRSACYLSSSKVDCIWNENTSLHLTITSLLSVLLVECQSSSLQRGGTTLKLAYASGRSLSGRSPE